MIGWIGGVVMHLPFYELASFRNSLGLTVTVTLDAADQKTRLEVEEVSKSGNDRLV